MQEEVQLKLVFTDEQVIMNIIFLQTGEIRQKKRSHEWLLERLFKHELKTWKKRWGEQLRLLGFRAHHRA